MSDERAHFWWSIGSTVAFWALLIGISVMVVSRH